MMRRGVVLMAFYGIAAVALATGGFNLAQTKNGPVDPGVRGGPAGAGGPLSGLTADDTAFFQDGQSRFADVEVVAGGANNGLGRLQSCAESFAGGCRLEWGKECRPVVHRAERSGARSTFQELQRGERRRSA